jgi:alanine transaminase
MIPSLLKGSRFFSRALVKDTIGSNVKNAEYAIRGYIVQRANEITQRLNKGEKFPFKKLLFCNIGNPLALGQPAFSFDRDVLSVIINPKLVQSNQISKDAGDRATNFINSVEYPDALGAYTASHGFPVARESVKKYIEERDGYPANINDIYLTDGASDGVKTIFTILLRGPQDGVMIPIPQYPLYNALISLLSGKAVPYYLDESKCWGLDMNNLEENYRKARAAGTNVRGIVMINPGNPTGQVMTRQNMEDVVKFCHKNSLVILADEVYQKNIYREKPFISFKKVINDLPSPYNEVELISFHSASKGVVGECGLRGGYMELHNIDNFTSEQILKLRSISLCSNTIGQVMTELMVNPPKEGVNSPEVVEKHNKEYDLVFGGLKKRSIMLTEKLNSIPGIKTNEIEGALYAYPRVFLPERAIKAAKERGLAPDAMYCVEALEDCGLVLVPGSGCGQKDGTHHFRITNLIFNTAEFDQALEAFKRFNEKFFAKYA